MERNQIIVLILLIIYIFTNYLFYFSTIVLPYTLLNFAIPIIGLIFSILLIRGKKLGFGITFLIIFSLLLLYWLIIYLFTFTSTYKEAEVALNDYFNLTE